MAGIDTQKQLLSLIRDFTSERSRGEQRVVGLKKRFESLPSEVGAANAEVENAKRIKEVSEEELNGYEVESSLNDATIQSLEARIALLQDDISSVGNEADAPKNTEGLLRDQFINQMVELNEEIRVFQKIVASSVGNDDSTGITATDVTFSEDGHGTDSEAIKEMLSDVNSQLAKEEEGYLAEQKIKEQLQKELEEYEQKMNDNHDEMNDNDGQDEGDEMNDNHGRDEGDEMNDNHGQDEGDEMNDNHGRDEGDEMNDNHGRDEGDEMNDNHGQDEDDESNKSIKVLIDLENGGFPSTIAPHKAVENLRKYLNQLGYSVYSMTTYACTDGGAFTESYFNKIKDINEMRLELVPKSGVANRDDADISLKHDLLSHMLRYKPPAPLFLNSSDKDFLPTINLLRKRHFKVIVAYGEKRAGAEIERIGVKWEPIALGNLIEANANLPTGDVSSPPKRTIPAAPTNLRAKVFWDYRTCPLAPHVKVRTLLKNLDSSLQERGCFGCEPPITVYALRENISVVREAELVRNKVNIVFVEQPEKIKVVGQMFVFEAIVKDMYDWLSVSSELLPSLVISDDGDLEKAVNNIRSFEYPVYVAHSENAQIAIGLEGGPPRIKWEILSLPSSIKKRGSLEAKGGEKKKRRV